MTTKVNSNHKSRKKTYDAHSIESCPSCSGTVVYRRSSYFGNKIYYKVCNNCGWYKIMDRDTWMEAVFTKAEKPEEKTKVKANEPDLSSDQTTEKVETEVTEPSNKEIEEKPTIEVDKKPKRNRKGEKPSKAKENDSE